MNARRKRLEKYCNALNCDTLVAFEPENLFYLTGFWGEAIGILEKGGKTTIIAPELEAQRAKEDSINCNVITSQRGGLVSSLASTIKRKKICTDSRAFRSGCSHEHHRVSVADEYGSVCLAGKSSCLQRQGPFAEFPFNDFHNVPYVYEEK